MKIRCAIGKDAEVELENTTSIKKLKELYYKQASIDSKEYPIDFSRLFYKGKEMKENHQLGEYNLENECVVQLFVRKRDCN